MNSPLSLDDIRAWVAGELSSDDARRVAEEMGFPHYVLDYENVFKDAVIDEFADSYLAGATPVPCIRWSCTWLPVM